MEIKEHNLWINVECISEREGVEQVKVGRLYKIDKMSIWIDYDGTAYGKVFSCDNYTYIGQMKLSHFRSI